MKMSIFQRFN